MTKMYYITNRQAVAEAAHLFKEAHWFDLPNGEVFLVAKFSHEGMEFMWRTKTDVDPLPHMLSRRAADPVKHVAKLKHLGAQENDSTFDIAEKVGQHYPLHHPTAF